jgi:hypothetical protein
VPSATTEQFQVPSANDLPVGIVLHNLQAASKLLFSNLSSFSEFVHEEPDAQLKRVASQPYMEELKDIEEPDEFVSISQIKGMDKTNPPSTSLYTLNDDDPETVMSNRQSAKEKLDKIRNFGWGWNTFKKGLHRYVPATVWLPKYTRYVFVS